MSLPAWDGDRTTETPLLWLRSRGRPGCESLPRAKRAEPAGRTGIRPDRSARMLMAKERPQRARTLRGWAMKVLEEAGAIHECEEHGWAKERADPHAREHALVIARQEP